MDYFYDTISEPMNQSLEMLNSAEVAHGEGGGFDFDYYADDFEGDTDYETMPGSMTLMDISQACVLPTLSYVSMIYLQIFSMCFGFQILNKLPFINCTVKHILSFLFGFAALWLNFQILILHFVLVSLVSYVFIYTLKCSVMTISIGLLSYLTVCEFLSEGVDWARIRSLQMILVMKIISLVSDLQHKRISEAPTCIQFLGYLFSISNCIYGPWISFSAYTDIIRPKAWRTNYFSQLAIRIVASLFCFVLSTCYLDWLLPDEFGWNVTFIYKQALIFRTSHYFIMFMAESFILTAGHVPSKMVRPSKIEVPRSLVEVVVYWNVPMHNWLKTYVFKPLWRHGRFIAITGTYFVSSLLHGLNYQLSGILLSLAFYTYIEHVLRKKLAGKLNACIQSKPCSSECNEHRYTHHFVFVKIVNLMFTFVTIYHLSYLGSLIDLQNDKKLSFEESFQRWHFQSYSSHILAFVMAVIILFL